MASNLAQKYATKLWEDQDGLAFFKFLEIFNDAIAESAKIEREECAKLLEKLGDGTDWAAIFFDISARKIRERNGGAA